MLTGIEIIGMTGGTGTGIVEPERNVLVIGSVTGTACHAGVVITGIIAAVWM